MVVRNRDTPDSSQSAPKRSSKLMQTACAGLLGASTALGAHNATATEFNEASGIPGGDFANTPALADLIPAGTTFITGDVTGFSAFPDVDDYFRFQKLVAGTAFEVEKTSPGVQVFSLTNSLGQSLAATGTASYAAGSATDSDGTVRVEVPADGIVLGRFGQGEGLGSYTVAISAAEYAIPEPSTMAFVAAGAAALLGRRRRDSEDSEG